MQIALLNRPYDRSCRLSVLGPLPGAAVRQRSTQRLCQSTSG